MKISILGAGNVATQLALAFKKAGHEIVQIYNRSDDAGKDLATTVGASFTRDTENLLPAEIYIIAVKDDAIEAVASQLELGDKILAHTSGVRSKDFLAAASKNYGIFYPLQSMTKTTKVDFKNVPVLIDANNEATLNTLKNLAATISRNAYVVDEEQRQWVHVAAVFANNFTNHLYGIAEHITTEHNMPFDILKPLIFRLIEGLEKYSPAELQTGPAIRKDFQTIDKHLQLLTDNHRLQQVYKVLTDSIIAEQVGTKE